MIANRENGVYFINNSIVPWYHIYIYIYIYIYILYENQKIFLYRSMLPRGIFLNILGWYTKIQRDFYNSVVDVEEEIAEREEERMKTGAPGEEGKERKWRGIFVRDFAELFARRRCAVSARILRVPEITAVYSECAESPRTSRADRDPSSRPRRLISRPILWGMIRP